MIYFLTVPKAVNHHDGNSTHLSRDFAPRCREFRVELVSLMDHGNHK